MKVLACHLLCRCQHVQGSSCSGFERSVQANCKAGWCASHVFELSTFHHREVYTVVSKMSAHHLASQCIELKYHMQLWAPAWTCLTHSHVFQPQASHPHVSSPHKIHLLTSECKDMGCVPPSQALIWGNWWLHDTTASFHRVVQAAPSPKKNCELFHLHLLYGPGCPLLLHSQKSISNVQAGHHKVFFFTSFQENCWQNSGNDTARRRTE